jgi:hypothetical protein
MGPAPHPRPWTYSGRQPFDAWRADVDQIVWRRAGCSLHDLPDVCLRDWYDDGLPAAAAAGRALRAAREE